MTYGLRFREVAAMTVDDIDCGNDRLRIPERKGGHSTAYPLSTIVGEAILDFKGNRPQTTDRHLFFRTMAPQAPMTCSSVSASASRYLYKSSIKVSRAGSHTLRHTCVQRLVDADLSFRFIGDYVGQRTRVLKVWLDPVLESDNERVIPVESSRPETDAVNARGRTEPIPNAKPCSDPPHRSSVRPNCACFGPNQRP